MATLNKQVWVKQLIENLYPETSFLNHTKDFSDLVENDKINLAESGVDPVVLVNNTAYPIEIKQRVDKPLEIELDKFETENTVVRRPEALEYAYDQLESVLMGHRNTLRANTAEKAAHAFAPSGNTANTPVLQTTGANDNGRKRLTIEDILNLKTCYDELDYPTDKRVLVLHPKHVADLILFDTKAFKDITDLRDGKPQRFAGFHMLQYTRNAYFNKAGLTKVPYGAVIDPLAHAFSSFSFYGDEVMKADGEVYMYIREDDPEQRGTIVGFDKRFIGVPIRNKGIGAIVSADV